MKFETHVDTENNIEIRFETPIVATQVPSLTPKKSTTEETSIPTIVLTLDTTPTVVTPLSTSLPTPVIHTVDVTVKANQVWQDTGITISASDTVTVEYLSGQWGVNDPQERFMTASGISRTSSDAPLSSSNLGALIGKIGTGEPFVIGSENVFVSSESGVFYLQINDGFLDDNEGEVQVQISVSSETSFIQPQVSAKDGMIMMHIPAGNFMMGSDIAWPEQAPVHDIYLVSFWIDQTEVTNAKYSLCVEDTACQLPKNTASNTRGIYYGNPEFNQYPVVFVTWHDAARYCQWAGRRLPTEAEWEKAARGTDERIYPWGNSYPTSQLANFNNNEFDTTEVGSFVTGASPYGALDMAGNVEEWVADWYGAEYYANSPERNPTGPSNGGYRMLRGGSWFYDEFYIRTAYRNSFRPDGSNNSVGFRCALSAAP